MSGFSWGLAHQGARPSMGSRTQVLYPEWQMHCPVDTVKEDTGVVTVAVDSE